MEFCQACEAIAAAVEEVALPLVNTREGGTSVGIGAAQSETKLLDKVAEDAVIELLREFGLCRTLISEECGRIEIGGDAGTIFLDPIDGTYNALSGIPFFALSIAYAENGQVIRGYVRDLANRETFTAERGHGARLNGAPITSSRTDLLEESAMSIYGRKFDPANVMDLGRTVRRWRLLGASALELCYVGAGRLDGFIDLRGTLRVTDAAAGMLVCSEAGGIVTDRDGSILRFPDEVRIGRCLVATNGPLHRKVVEYLR
ncbi:MAG: bifunctional fructose-bisphosphatase/inositol-phosphate phosphatase [Methanospirillum sp.]|nr:bifunctional fructose-bisphosphatase/inositol-phosphate phosphatase [Methanospirillum sp.]